MSNSPNNTERASVLYPWFAEHGVDLIHELDRDTFQALSPYGKVFTLESDDDEFVRLSYGSRVFRVKPSLIQHVPTARYQVDDVVRVNSNGKTAIVEHVQWHHRDGKPFYILRFGNKRDSRRYSDAELSLCPDSERG